MKAETVLYGGFPWVELAFLTLVVDLEGSLGENVYRFRQS